MKKENDGSLSSSNVETANQWLIKNQDPWNNYKAKSIS